MCKTSAQGYPHASATLVYLSLRAGRPPSEFSTASSIPGQPQPPRPACKLPALRKPLSLPRPSSVLETSSWRNSCVNEPRADNLPRADTCGARNFNSFSSPQAPTQRGVP
eukprot:1179891-Prorocentrum_minimum.AAC.2